MLKSTSASPKPSVKRLQSLMQLEEDDAEVDLGFAQALQQRRSRRRRRRRIAPRRFLVRQWILRRTDFGHYDNLTRELEAEGHGVFTNFLRVPPDMYRALEERLTPRLMKKDKWYREALKPGLKLAISLRY